LSALVERCRLAGIRLRVEGTDLCCDAPKGALTSELLTALKANKPAILAALAPPDLPGVSPDFAARLSPDDLAGREVGDIPLAFEEAAIAREAEDLRESFEERAGILEYDAGLPRSQAEIEAARITATLARNRGHLWASLRAALADYPALLAQVPDTPGPVDALPLGTAKVAVLPGRRVVRQGAFGGEHEVKA